MTHCLNELGSSVPTLKVGYCVCVCVCVCMYDPDSVPQSSWYWCIYVISFRPLSQAKGVDLTCVRNCIALSEERPRHSLLASFGHLFHQLGLSQKAVSASFGCKVNLAVCLQVWFNVCACSHVFACVCACLHVFACVCVCYYSIWVSTYTWVCLHVNVFACFYKCLHVLHMHVCIPVCLHVFVCI